jgi:hypothetical protein
MIMNIRISFTLVLIVLVAYTSRGQSDEPKFYHWSLGISSGDIIHNLFNTVDTNRSYAAFVLEYTGEKYALQLGFRPGYNLTDTRHEGFIDSEITEDDFLLSPHQFHQGLFLKIGSWVFKPV